VKYTKTKILIFYFISADGTNMEGSRSPKKKVPKNQNELKKIKSKFSLFPQFVNLILKCQISANPIMLKKTFKMFNPKLGFSKSVLLNLIKSG